MEITVKQAIYAILTSSFATGSPLFNPGTVKSTRKTLEKVYGVKVSRGHTSRLIKEIAQECRLLEYKGQRQASPTIYLPSEKLYKLVEPAEILKAKKWKRDGSRQYGAK